MTLNKIPNKIKTFKQARDYAINKFYNIDETKYIYRIEIEDIWNNKCVYSTVYIEENNIFIVVFFSDKQNPLIFNKYLIKEAYIRDSKMYEKSLLFFYTTETIEEDVVLIKKNLTTKNKE